VVDALVDKVIHAGTREDLVAATRALDRVLLSGRYVIPHWQLKATRIAYWDYLHRPEVVPLYGLDLFSWWADPAKAAERSSGKQGG
jgi:microcin C transport system substrate-binding protein